MDHDLGLGGEGRVFDSVGGGVQDVGDVGVGRGGAEGPEEASADLVTDGDYGGLDPGRLVRI